MDKARFYKLLINILALYLLSVALFNLGRNVTSTTDENLFRDAPSRLYISKNIPVTSEPDSSHPGIMPDSIQVGDFLVSVQGRRLQTSVEVTEHLAQLSPNALVKLEVFRTSSNSSFQVTVDRQALPDDFARQIPQAAYVYQIEPEGASERAGMQVGDLIVAINGRHFADAIEATVILQRAESGKTTSYDIIRDDQNIQLAVNLARLGLRFSEFSMFLSGLIFWGAGAFLGVKNLGNAAAKRLGMGFLLFGFFFMATSMLQDRSLDAFATLRTATLLLSTPFALAFSLDSALYFPDQRRRLTSRPWAARSAYLVAALFSAYFFVFVLGPWQSLGLAQAGFWSMIILMLLYKAVSYYLCRADGTKEDRKIRRTISFTTLGAFLASALVVYLAVRSGDFRQQGYAGIPLTIIPLAYLYLIGRYQLLGIDLHIRRNIQYIVVSTIWLSFLGIVLAKSILLLPDFSLEIPNISFTGKSFVVIDTPPDPATHDFWEKLIMILLALGMTFLSWRVAKAGQRSINRVFNRRQFDMGSATAELAEIMATKLGMVELARGIIEKLARLMQLKNIGILFFRDQRVCCCHEAYGVQIDSWDRLCSQEGGQLIAELNRYRTESRFSIENLPYGLKEDFRQNGFRHILPIRFKDKLVGTFLIGEKLSESPLHLDDLTFLSATAQQASIAIENAFLHEELTEQERLKHELDIARRIQMASLPQKTPQVSGLDISGISIPAAEVGGDYFDYLNGTRPGLTVIVGDVSGKGTSAALYMSKAQGIIRSLHAFDLSPKELFVRANHLLCQDLEKKSFITALGAQFDTSRRNLVLARAGHLPLFHYDAMTDSVKLLTPPGLGLGLDGADIFVNHLEEKTISYAAGDIFLFVTDGITEAQTAYGNEFGEERLAELLKLSCADGAHEIRERVLAEVRSFVRDSLQHDDQTIVVVKAG